MNIALLLSLGKTDFSKRYYFRNFLRIISFQTNVSSSFFQYSERTINSTEVNDTSKERSDTQLFWSLKIWGRGITKRAPRSLAAKRHWKEKKMTEPIQEVFFLIVPILFLYYELIVCPLLLNYNKVHFGSSLNWQT